jgi:DNA polymerase I
MSANCAASSISWLDQFETAWHVDFEYRQNANHCSVPVSLFAYEEHTGTELCLTRDQLLQLRRAPFGTGPRDLVIAYAANAEISCFQMLGWPQPRNVLDLYVEACAVLNGRTDLWDSKGRPGLVAVLEMLGLPSITAAEKKEMRELIIGHETYTAEQWEAIKAYNRSDVEATRQLLPVLAPQFDLPHALHRGRYMAAVACQEVLGLPVNTDLLNRLIEHWQAIQLYYIARDDEFGLYEGASFREERLEALIIRKKWDWPRHPTGRLQLSSKVISQQAKRNPELRKLVKLRDTIAELRISKLANTIGEDGFSRCPMLPFWTRTSRCQPSDPASAFDDLNKLRQEQRVAPARRARSMQTFARIPHDAALALYRHRLPSAAWVLLIELDRILLKRRGKNPFKLSSRRLRAIGLKSQTRYRALRQLETAGVVKVERIGQGMSPWVTHLWYPVRD